MLRFLTIALILFVIVSAAGATRHRLPDKPSAVFPPNIPDPNRQGGDTVEDATVVPSLPFSDTGTTTGFADDYDEVCPYTGSTSPDVVYAYTAPADGAVTIDLCGSGYDTKLYVYDDQLELVACNDDAYFGDPCGMYVSAIEGVLVSGGVTYSIVIDGYGGDHGDYVLEMTESVPCILGCPAGGFPEGEPPLVDGYVDSFNGGCNSPEFGYPFKDIVGDANGDLTFCGVAGWYDTQTRDTDWFFLYMGSAGAIELTADAEYETYLFELPQDCNIPAVNQMIVVGPCAEDAMIISGQYYDPGEAVWFWAGSSQFTAPPGAGNEYDYVIWFSGLLATVTTEPTTWSSLKALYR